MAAEPAPTSLTPATAADFGPVAFYGDRTPDDPAVLLDGLPLERLTALKQRADDLHAQIPTFEEVKEVQNTKIAHANRIAELIRHKSEGGFGLDEHAPQVSTERRKLERAEQEFTRLSSLKEVRTARWNAVGQVYASASDWLLRGGIPANCVIEAVEDAPLIELLTKNDSGRIDTAVERNRMRLRELSADLHRVKSAPWPSSVAKAAARELIDQLADAGAPNFDGAIEFGQPIGFATKRLTSLVHNVDAPGAVAYMETVDAFSTMCWVFRDQMLAKIEAGLVQAADDKAALSQQQREEMEAQINLDALMTERNECSLIWHADAKGEVIDFRNDTTPQAVLGVRLRNVPRAVASTTTMNAFDLIQPGGR